MKHVSTIRRCSGAVKFQNFELDLLIKQRDHWTFISFTSKRCLCAYYYTKAYTTANLLH